MEFLIGATNKLKSIMEVIRSIKSELIDSNRPIAKAIHKTDCGSSMCIGFNREMKLNEHVTHKPTTLLVLYGSIIYSEKAKTLQLDQLDQYKIPISMPHTVEAREDSMILLMQG